MKGVINFRLLFINGLLAAKVTTDKITGFSYFISVFNDYQIPVSKLIILSLMECPPHGVPYHVCLIAAPTWDGGTSISSICYHHVRIVS